MKDRKGIVSVLLFIIALLGLLGITNDSLFVFFSEYFSYIVFFFVFVIFLTSEKKLSRCHIVLAIVITVLMLMSMVNTASGLGSYLNLINIVLIMLLAGNIDVEEKTKKTISIIALLSFATLFVKSTTIWQEYTSSTAIINPNTIAQFLTINACILYQSISKFINKKSLKNILQILLLLTSLIGAVMCNSRTSIMVILFMIIALRIDVIKNIILNKYKIFGAILVLLGSIIPFLYVNMYNNGIILDASLNTEKRFYSGREKIWKYSIEELDYHNGYMWGLGTHHETAIGEVSNFHNWYIGEIYYFGVIISVVLFMFVIGRLSCLKSNEVKILALSVLIFGFFETSLQWEYSQIVFLPLLLFDEYEPKPKVLRKKQKRFKLFRGLQKGENDS